ncbi:hypothetical protein E2C01_033042 [Portunus trituberculatus]|uniref:Transposable element Tc1 transposase n=1 Tax=Portunus trituberculatus TaxID=210409 RepID=A0A5B7F1D3_PORTR|nr:hypothetical protein [Portunus trituberculatus]
MKKPLVTLNQRCRRFEFCKKYYQWDADKWLDVLWTDESTFTVTGNRGGNVYRRAGSDPRDVQQTVKYPDSLMINHSRSAGSPNSLPANMQPIPNAKHLAKKPPCPAALGSLSALLEKMVEMLTGSVNSTLVIGSNKVGDATPALGPVESLPTPTSPTPSSLAPMKKAVETSL